MRLGAYALCLDSGDRLLLARVSEGRDAGAWTLPGGGINQGESPDLAVVREFREETGLQPRTVHGVMGIYSKVYEDHRGPHATFHHVGIVYRVTADGEPLPEADGSTDLSAWFSREEIRQIPLTPLGEFGCSMAWPSSATYEGERS